MMPFEARIESADSIMILGPKVFNTKTFNPSNGSVEALISSSSFEIIRNDTLRNLLVKWKDVYLDYAEEEQAARDYVLQEVSPFFLAEFDYFNQDSPGNWAMMSSKKFRNIWFDMISYRRQVLQAIKDEQVEWHIEEIIRLTNIDAENSQ